MLMVDDDHLLDALLIKEEVDMRVWNKREKNIPKEAIYVGRPSQFGNPFTVQTHGRGHALNKYRQWIATQPQLQETIKKELKNKDLVCWCTPNPCHADILMEIANR